jgi:hypothetical protein
LIWDTFRTFEQSTSYSQSHTMAKLSTVFVALAASALLASANPIAKGNTWPQWNAPEQAKCLYLATNLKPNAIRAIPVNEDGSLSAQGSTTMTGGDGGNELDAPKLTPHAPDALGSQGSVQLADNVGASPCIISSSC